MNGSSSSSHSLIDFGRLILFGGAALLAGVACAGWLDGHRGGGLPGTLQARSLTITAARPCTVAELLVETGQTVTADTPLVRLYDEKLEARLAHQQRELDRLRAEVTRATAAAEVELGWRRRELQSEVFTAQMTLATLQNERLSRQVEQIAWREHLASTPAWTGESASDPFLRPITLSATATGLERLQAVLKEDAAAVAAESLTAKIQLCEARLEELAALQQRLDANVRLSAGVEVAERRVSAAEAELAALQDQQRQLTLRSAGYGVVGLLLRQPGDRLAEGDAILELLDDDQRTVQARVPTERLGGVRVGDEVAVVFPDDIRRTGVVVAIPPQAVAGGASSTGTTELQIPIAPRGKLWPKTPIGTRVDVILSRR